MTLTELALNPFQGKEQGKQPEVEEKLDIGSDENVAKALEIYHGSDKKLAAKDYDCLCDYFNGLELPLLDPNQIELVMQRLRASVDRETLESEFTGQFFSRIIYKSYTNGYNNFLLTTGDTSINGLCVEIDAYPLIPLKVKVDGDVGDTFGATNYSCNFEVTGHTGYHFGPASKNCSYTVHGNTGFYIAEASRECEYTFRGGVGIIKAFPHNIKNCTFRTNNPETARRLRLIAREPKGNKVELIGDE